MVSGDGSGLAAWARELLLPVFLLLLLLLVGVLGDLDGELREDMAENRSTRPRTELSTPELLSSEALAEAATSVVEPFFLELVELLGEAAAAGAGGAAAAVVAGMVVTLRGSRLATAPLTRIQVEFLLLLTLAAARLAAVMLSAVIVVVVAVVVATAAGTTGATSGLSIMRTRSRTRLLSGAVGVAGGGGTRISEGVREDRAGASVVMGDLGWGRTMPPLLGVVLNAWASFCCSSVLLEALELWLMLLCDRHDGVSARTSSWNLAMRSRTREPLRSASLPGAAAAPMWSKAVRIAFASSSARSE